MKARRGDIAVIVTQVSDYVIGQGASERTQVEICEVTNITREGIVKAVRKANWGADSAPVSLDRWAHHHEVLIVPKTDIDVPAAIATAAANPWPHNGMPGKYYDTLAEAREALRPHRRTS